jgi:membrane protease YdiL (CAAX protease family)
LTFAFRFNRVSWLTVLSAVIFALGLVVVTDTIDRWIAPSINQFLDDTIGSLSPELRSERILEQIMLQLKFTNILSTTLLLFAAVVGAAYCEEMLIRGMFQRALENRFRAVWAILISSAVFALIHINPWGGIQIFIIAIALGVIAWKTNSIVPTIIVHGLNNFIVILFNNLSEEQLLWYGTKSEVHTHISVIGTGFFILGLWMLFYFKNRNN